MGQIELVYVPLTQQAQQTTVAFSEGMTVGDVLLKSGWLVLNPELSGLSMGIFSKPVHLDTLVKAGDRVELYRPLVRDPMDTRRARARGKASS